MGEERGESRDDFFGVLQLIAAQSFGGRRVTSSGPFREGPQREGTAARRITRQVR